MTFFESKTVPNTPSTTPDSIKNIAPNSVTNTPHNMDNANNVSGCTSLAVRNTKPAAQCTVRKTLVLNVTNDEPIYYPPYVVVSSAQMKRAPAPADTSKTQVNGSPTPADSSKNHVNGSQTQPLGNNFNSSGINYAPYTNLLNTLKDVNFPLEKICNDGNKCCVGGNARQVLKILAFSAGLLFLMFLVKAICRLFRPSRCHRCSQRYENYDHPRSKKKGNYSMQICPKLAETR